MDELCAETEGACDWQIFATDLDADAIAKGREGFYRLNIADDVGSDRLQKYFQREGDGYRIRKHLREKVVFAQQNVLTDPPFSRLDLVSCRNLLIYLDNKHQEQLLETFHFALREGGYLVLGTSESAGSRQREFATLDSKAHLFARKPGKSLARLSPRVEATLADSLTRLPRSSRRDRDNDLATRVRRSLIDRYTPAAVAVKADGEIAYYHGPVRKFIDHPEGAPSHSLFDILPSALRSRAREAIKAVSNGDEPSHKSVRIRMPDGDTSVCIECVELAADEERLFLLTFIEHGDRQPPVAGSVEEDGKYVRHLENELAIVQEDLQTTVEELETSNEELKASHEEAVAANEELQSANEELETSREELQSLNEELVTVNNQLEEKIAEVERASDDLQNLLTSTRLPVLFLGPELKISSYTPSMRELVELRETDIGRPVTELAFKAHDPDLLADVDRTMTSLALSEKQITSDDGKTFIRRVNPYRTSDERIHGVVVTYSDITEQAAVSGRLADREKQQRIIAELGQKGLAARDLDKFLNELCATLRVAMDCDYAKVLEYHERESYLQMIGGAGWKAGLVGKATVPSSVKSQAGYTVEHNEALVTDFRTERRFEAPELLVSHDVSSGVSCRIDIGGKPWGVLGLYDRHPNHFRDEDLLIIKAAANVAAATIKQILRERQTARESLILSLAIKTAEMGVWQFDPQTRAVVWDERLREIIGKERSRSQPVAEDFFALMHPDDLDRVQAALVRTVEDGDVFSEEFRLTRPDGREIWLIGRGERIVEVDRSTVVGINADITARKVADEQNRFVMRELDHRVKNVLAIILSIAKITGANAKDPASFIGSFERRLHAMARTHSLLAEGRWHGARLRALIADEVAHSGEGSEIVLEGPDVDLTPASAQNLSMALHELTTNALKYGSLSVAGGKLLVSWDWESGAKDEKLLRFRWKELGGPTVTAPGTKGFGSTVIERILRAQLGAQSEIRYAPEGLDVTCRIPASRIVSGASVGKSTIAPVAILPQIDLEPIRNARILVVDDEWLVAEQHAQALAGAGANVVGPFHTLDAAIRAVAEQELDFAVLDYNLDGNAVSPLVDTLERNGTPMLIVSGFGSELELAGRLDHLAFLAKPVSPAAMLGRVAQLIARERKA